MFPYILLIVIAFLFRLVARDSQSVRCGIRMGAPNNDVISRYNLALPAFFVMLFLLLALRSEEVGRDLANYKVYFDYYSQHDFPWEDMFEPESLYYFLNWAVGHLTGSYQVFLILVAAVTVWPVALLYCEDRRYANMKIAIFVSMSTFVMMFSGLRQAMAVSIGAIAYHFVKQKKIIPFILTVLLALWVHHSAFMIALFYPLYHLRLKTKYLLFVIPAGVAVFLFNQPIFRALMALFSGYTQGYEAQIGSTGAYTMLILFALFTVVAYVIPDESAMDKEAFGLRNFLVMALLLQCFAPIHFFAMRLNYYFILFIPLAMGKLLAVPKPGMGQVSRLATAVMVTYFTADFIGRTYLAYVTGESALDTVPYIPFWQ